MSVLKFLPIIFICAISCRPAALSQPSKSKIEGVIIESLLPDFDLDSSANKWVVKKYDPIYTKVYFYEGWVLLQRSHQYGEAVGTVIGENSINPDIVYRHSFHSIVYRESDSKAMYCDSANALTAKLIDKDSAIMLEPALNGMEASALQRSYRTLLKSSKNSDGDIEEFYSLKGKDDTTMRGSLTLIFSRKKMQGSRYSLDKQIEKDRKMKLIKIVTMTDERYVEAYKVGFGSATIPTEVKELKVDNAEELIKLINYAQQLQGR